MKSQQLVNAPNYLFILKLIVKVYTSHVCKISNQDSVTHRYNENEILTQKRKTRTCIESLINTHLSNLVGA